MFVRVCPMYYKSQSTQLLACVFMFQRVRTVTCRLMSVSYGKIQKLIVNCSRDFIDSFISLFSTLVYTQIIHCCCCYGG